jgi:dUTP pyrophosphatase
VRSIVAVTAPASPDARAAELPVQALDEAAVIPRRAHAGDAGLDLALLEAVRLEPGERRKARTGIAVAIPEGHAGFVVPRSGLAARLGLSVVNTPGIIDAGYRGELLVLLLNTDREHAIELAAGERVAQLLVVPVAVPQVVAVDTLPEAGDARGTGGYGSTGTA